MKSYIWHGIGIILPRWCSKLRKVVKTGLVAFSETTLRQKPQKAVVSPKSEQSCECSSVGRAVPCQGTGRRFEPDHSLHVSRGTGNSSQNIPQNIPERQGGWFSGELLFYVSILFLLVAAVYQDLSLHVKLTGQFAAECSEGVSDE